MELQDYAAALRRYWTTWIGLTVAGVLTALSIVVFATPTYQATATVFVASGEGTAGSQFVNQRVTSYPDIAVSRAVLAPVIGELGLGEPITTLRTRVAATNPPDTSLVRVTVTDEDPVWAADVANAVADEFRAAVEDLETPREGSSPVSLTVTDLAAAPSSPVFPAPDLLLPVGLVVGLAVGLAAAVVQSRRDTRLHTEDDVRDAWGHPADEFAVHAPARRDRRSSLAPRPATLLARQLEPLAEAGPVRVVVISPSEDRRAARSFVDDVAAVLQGWAVQVHRLEMPSVGLRVPATAGVQLAPGTPFAPLREWRDLARHGVVVVVVVDPGRVERAELREVRSILSAAGIHPLAVVLHAPRRGRASRKAVTAGTAPARAAVDARSQETPVPAGRG